MKSTYLQKYFLLITPNGFSKAIYPNGIIGYEGEIKQGKPHGKGKTFYPNGILGYESEILFGKPHGQGKEYYDTNGILYTDDKDITII